MRCYYQRRLRGGARRQLETLSLATLPHVVYVHSQEMKKLEGSAWFIVWLLKVLNTYLFDAFKENELYVFWLLEYWVIEYL